MTVDQRIQLVLKGSRTAEGAVDFDALLSFGDAFRRALRALARSRAGQPAVRPGQPASDVREASSLRLVGLRAGSAVLEFEPLEARLFDDPAVGALQALVDGLSGQETLEPAVTVLLADAVQSLGDGASVGLRVPGRSLFEFDAAHLALLAPSPAPSPPDAEGYVDGWLHAVDLEPDEVRIRDASGRDWWCHYPDELEVRVQGLIGRVVRASGIVRPAGQRARIDATAVEPIDLQLDAAGTADEMLAAAMAAAGIEQPQDLASLAAEVDGSADEELAFEEALRAIR